MTDTPEARRAFDSFVGEARSIARRRARQWGLSAEDAIQEAMVALVVASRRHVGLDDALFAYRARRDVNRAVGAWVEREARIATSEQLTDPFVLAETLDQEDSGVQSPEMDVLDAETMERLESALRLCRPRVAAIVRARVGLLTGVPMTFGAIAGHFGFADESGARKAVARARKRLASVIRSCGQEKCPVF